MAFASGQPAGVDENTHVVADGETLWDIAAANGVDLEALAARNGLSSDALVAAGDTLVIPASAPDGGG
ncbi:MAG: LysM domain-containing protein [Dehalococcoidia bacterium]